MSVDDEVFYKAPEPKLEYFVSEKASFAVLTFVGQMVKATLGVLEECEKDLNARTATLYAICFRDVSEVDLNVLAPLTRLQKMLRDRGALCICSLKPDHKKLFTEKAVIRDSEYQNNLTAGLESLKTAQANIKHAAIKG